MFMGKQDEDAFCQNKHGNPGPNGDNHIMGGRGKKWTHINLHTGNHNPSITSEERVV